MHLVINLISTTYFLPKCKMFGAVLYCAKCQGIMLDISRLMHVTPPLGTVRRMKRNADLDSTLGELLRKHFSRSCSSDLFNAQSYYLLSISK